MTVKTLYWVEASCIPGVGGDRFTLTTHIAATNIQEALSSAEDALGRGLGYGLREVTVLNIKAMGKVVVVDD